MAHSNRYSKLFYLKKMKTIILIVIIFIMVQLFSSKQVVMHTNNHIVHTNNVAEYVYWLDGQNYTRREYIGDNNIHDIRK